MTGALRVITIAVIAGAASTIGPLSVRASAQARFTYVGPKQCTNCHDHEEEKLWYEKKEIPEAQRLFPDSKNAGHVNSLKQLETPKSDEFAKAVGLADKYRPGRIVRHLPRHRVPGGCERRSVVRKLPRPGERLHRAAPEERRLRRVGGAVWDDASHRQLRRLDAAMYELPRHERQPVDRRRPSVGRRLRSVEEVPAGQPAFQEDVHAGRCRRNRARRDAGGAAAAPRDHCGCRNCCAGRRSRGGLRRDRRARISGRCAGRAVRCAVRVVRRAVFDTATTARAPRAAGAAAERAAPAGKSARSSTAGAIASPPRPRPRLAPIDPANPPAGSPTSIEPPSLPTASDSVPQPAAAPAPAQAAAPEPAVPTTPPTAVAVRTSAASWYVWVGLAVVIVAVAIAVLARKRR